MLDARAEADTRFGCRSRELIYRGAYSTLYRAVRVRDGATVVVKHATDDRSERDHARSLRHEYATLCTLAGSPHVVAARALELETDSGRLALLLEDAGPHTLRRLTSGPALAFDALVTLALGSVDALQALHARGVIHHAFQPDHAVVTDAGVVKLLDFSWATTHASHMLGLSPRRSMGTSANLAYTAPEQTGRMNRSVDYRADFYALGVTLFELATGELPFDQQDPLELLHAHLARKAPQPKLLRSTLPTAFSRMVAKLLAKDAEERYQSSHSLRSDLERCASLWQRGEADFNFELGVLGVTDQPRAFAFPQRLYGRARELERLNQAFERTQRGELQCVHVVGAAGSGKSALCRELSRSVTACRGYFIAGKFEQTPHSVPHRALAQALDALVQHLLTESPSRLETWRKRIQTAPSVSTEVLVELCPSFSLVVGRQAAPGAVDSQSARRRLLHGLIGLFNALATTTEPLCLLFDDLQWAPRDELELLGELLRGLRTAPLLVLLTVRVASASARESNPPTLSLAPFFESLSQASSGFERLELAELELSDVVSLVHDTIPMGRERSYALGRVVHARTAGNPLFLREFLELLHHDGLLARAAAGQNHDALDLAAVEAHCVTDNVVEMLLERIEQLPADTREVLQVAACIGNRFELALLTHVCGDSADSLLSAALAADLILRFQRLEAASDNAPTFVPTFQFAHDRIQQAVLGSLDTSTRRNLHQRIATALRELTLAEPVGVGLFALANHLNQALRGDEDLFTRVHVAQLDLRAARQALAAGAGAECLALAQAGIAALGHDAFEQQYELARDLHLMTAEAAFAWADHAALAASAEVLLCHARTGLDSARVWRLQGRVLQSQYRGADAIRTYRTALAALGIELPEQVSDAERTVLLEETAQLLGDRDLHALAQLPTCSDEAHVLAMELLSKLIFFAYATTSPLLPSAVCQLVRLSVLHGNTAESANGYTFYGYLLSHDHDLTRACAFGRLAIDIAHRFDDRSILSQTYLYAHYQLLHWTTPMRELTGLLRTAERYGLDAGSPLNAACSATTLSICRFWAGEELDQLTADMERQRTMIVQFKQELVLNWHEVLLQAVLDLQSDAAPLTCLAGPVYDESKRLPIHESKGDHSAIFNWSMAKSLLAYLLGDTSVALATVERAAGYARQFGTALWAVPSVYVDCLCRLAACESDAAARPQLIAQVERNCEKLARWEPHNPAAIQHKLRTLQAQLASVRGERALAQSLFAEAIALAQTSGANHEEGMACELAARHHLRLGEGGRARAYLRASHRAFARWGAVAKLRRMEEEYSGLLPRSLAWSTANERDALAELDTFDLRSVLRASQVISGEIQLDKLLHRVLSLLLENSGAETGYLLREHAGRWLVELGLSASGQSVSLRKAVPLEEAARSEPGLAASVVHYVARTGETLVLGNASQSTLFANDPHVQKRRVASVLCFKVTRPHQTRALIYLENNLLRDAFTPSCIGLLQLLSSQAMISLENARLYSGMEDLVSQRTRELEAKNNELGEALTKLMEAQRQLVTQEKLAALGVLTAGIAHEIKNPLNFVTNFAEVSADLTERLERRLDPELLPASAQREVRELLQQLRATVTKVAQHGLRASGIITRMAEHASRARSRREPVDINAIVAQSIELSSQEQGRAPDTIQIETRCQTELAHVSVIAEDMRRVLINLINNAHHAVLLKQQRGRVGYVPSIVISTQDAGSHAEIRVWDNGIGVARSERERIFIPFFTTKAPGQGTGLGLSLTQDIVVRGHQGELRIDSTEGEFCELIVRLPKHAG
ncbi:MAG: hypothetical protein RL701_6723 [Pseudomonadota bacterium]